MLVSQNSTFPKKYVWYFTPKKITDNNAFPVSDFARSLAKIIKFQLLHNSCHNFSEFSKFMIFCLVSSVLNRDGCARPDAGEGAALRLAWAMAQLPQSWGGQEFSFRNNPKHQSTINSSTKIKKIEIYWEKRPKSSISLIAFFCIIIFLKHLTK